tara:strand:+ start:4721 stop:5770 length:1050 start_codon:yes stop_codon:yes gene_type:complete
MADIIIKTNLTNVTDGASSTTSASLDGVPFTTSTIINSRTFTVDANHTFSVEPFIDLSGVSTPSDYSVTTTKVANTSKTFTVKYHHPLKPPTTDIIQFFATAKLNPVRPSDKIYSYVIDEKEIHPNGESRLLTVTGNPNSSISVDVTKNPKINPIGDQTIMVGPLAYYVIGEDGRYQTNIKFPKTSLLTNYKVKLSERISGSFSGINNPSIITLTQYPLQQTKLLVADGGLGTTLPADSVTNRYYFYSAKKGQVTYGNNFSFTVTKLSGLLVKNDFTASSFTQATATSSTLTDTAIDSIIEYSNLSITINNTVSPNTARIEGNLKINHGYDSGGHTLVTLDVNNILQNL